MNSRYRADVGISGDSCRSNLPAFCAFTITHVTVFIVQVPDTEDRNNTQPQRELHSAQCYIIIVADFRCTCSVVMDKESVGVAVST